MDGPPRQGHPEAKTEGSHSSWMEATGKCRPDEQGPCWGAARQMLAVGVRVLPLSSSPPSPRPPGVPIPTFLPARLPGGLASEAHGGGKSLIPKILAFQAAV